MTSVMKFTSLVLIVCILTSCMTIHRHPKATALIVGTVVGVTVGVKLGYQKGCPSSVNGIPYSGTPPCPTHCDALGDCYWGTGPHKK